MEQANSIFKAIASSRRRDETFIACLYTGAKFPKACSPMLRAPVPSVGMLLAELSNGLSDALAENPAVHDGAIMVGRVDLGAPYRVTAWSFRLFPATTTLDASPNRGSAFHSCLSMSLERDIDALYLITGNRAYRFVSGVDSSI
jgi:hypothetical protein